MSSSSSNPQDASSSSEADKRKAIAAIFADPSLDEKQRARKMQELMSGGYSSRTKKTTKKSLTPDDDPTQWEPTYTDETKTTMGCKHYKRDCKLVAACCGGMYSCRFCHDEACDHTIDRYATEQMLCMHCRTVQPIAASCSNPACGKELCDYFCDVCGLWTRDMEVFHCPECRLCRVGRGLGDDYFHCSRCNACMSTALRKHVCIERNLESDCPICGVYLFTSTTPVVFMNCGHCMHSECLSEYSKTNYTCPICSKSLGDMSPLWQEIDIQLATEEMPDEYKDMRSTVLCNDCGTRSIAPFHFIYHKCGSESCGSYNTKVLGTWKLGTALDPDVDPSSPYNPSPPLPPQPSTSRAGTSSSPTPPTPPSSLNISTTSSSSSSSLAPMDLAAPPTPGTPSSAGTSSHRSAMLMSPTPSTSSVASALRFDAPPTPPPAPEETPGE